MRMITNNIKYGNILINPILLIVIFIFYSSFIHAQNNDLHTLKQENTNVILLMADDLGYGDVGFTGNTSIRTPNLDEMARSGITFDRFYAASPLCSPTRASCLTGRNPFRQRIFAAHTAGMREAETTITDNTIVFFCSDNGPDDKLASNGIASVGPLRGHKHQMWEGGIRVPSLVEWPGHIKEGVLCSVPAGTVDYLPTILDALGLPPFTENPIDGISLIPVMLGEVTKRDVPLAFGYQRLYKGLELYALI